MAAPLSRARQGPCGRGDLRVGTHLGGGWGSPRPLPPIPSLDLPGVVTSDGLLGEGMYHPRLTIITAAE
ncbi:MAG: hypothetical protein ACLSAF_18540 [Intestinimonas sp.]